MDRPRARGSRALNLVSMCLLGCPCRYDGASKPNPEVLARLRSERMIAVCPENLAGFPTPRIKIHIEGGSGDDVLDGRALVKDEDGSDVTAAMLDAVRQIEKQVDVLKVEKAYLKERSPSCGCRLTAGPDGALPGRGVAAAALWRKGVDIVGFD